MPMLDSLMTYRDEACVDRRSCSNWQKTLNEVFAGVSCGILLYLFSIAFAVVIFGSEGVGLQSFVALGVGVHTLSTCITGLGFTFFSSLPISIAGPDVNPTVFFLTIAITVRKSIYSRFSDAVAENVTKVIDSAKDLQTEAEIHPRLLPTVLVSIALGTFLIGALFITLGKCRLTRVIRLLPAAVLAGLMAAVGARVFDVGIRMATGHWFSAGDVGEFVVHFLPAFVVGLVLYATQRFDWGRPDVVLFCLVFCSFAGFYGVIYGGEGSLEAARENEWLCDGLADQQFFKQFSESYGQVQNIDGVAIAQALPDMLVMLLIVTIDFSLKLSDTKKAVGVDSISHNHELELAGKVNIVVAILMGAPGYSQLNLNKMNFRIIKNTSSRLPGQICAFMNLALFLFGSNLVQYVPKFLLAGLLIYASLGYLVSNLVDSFTELTLKEYLVIWIILLVSILSDLIITVLTGIVLGLFIFTLQHGKRAVVKAVISGRDYQSNVVRSTQEDSRLEHLGTQVLIIKLQSYLFFGSIDQITDIVKKSIRRVEERAQNATNIKYVVFDWAAVDGMDYAASEAVSHMIHQLSHKDASRPTSIIPLFSGMNEDVYIKLKADGVLDQLHESHTEDHTYAYELLEIPRSRAFASFLQTRGKTKHRCKGSIDCVRSCVFKAGPATELDDYAIPYYKQIVDPKVSRRLFPTLDLAVEWVEERLLTIAATIRRRWLICDSFRELHERARRKAKYELFEHILGAHLGASLWKYVEPLRVNAGWTLCVAGHINPHLYLLQHGRLTAYVEKPDGSRMRVQTMRRGAFVNEEALFVEMPVSHTIVADTDCIVLALSRSNIKKLEAYSPSVAFELHRNLLRHTSRTRNKLSRELEAVDHIVKTDDSEYISMYSIRHSKQKRPSSLPQLWKAVKSAAQQLIGEDDFSFIVVDPSKGISAPDDILREQKTVFESIRDYDNWKTKSNYKPDHLFCHVSADMLEKSVRDWRQVRHRGNPGLMLSNVRNAGVEAREAYGETTSACESVCSSVFSDGDEAEELFIEGGKYAQLRLSMSPKMIREATSCYRNALKSFQQGSNSRLTSPPVVSFEACHRALMDLGYFPEASALSEKIKEMKRATRRSESDIKTFYLWISEEEFLQLVTDYSLSTLSLRNLKIFYKVFSRYSQVSFEDSAYVHPTDNDREGWDPVKERVLYTENLHDLMEHFGHAEDDITIEKLVNEWGKIKAGSRFHEAIPSEEEQAATYSYLEFPQFCSMMAFYLKSEELEARVEKDWKALFSPLDENQTVKFFVGPEDIVRVFRDRGTNITFEEAKELVFEASSSDFLLVSFSDFITCLTTFFESEVGEADDTTTEQLRNSFASGELKDIGSVSGHGPEVSTEMEDLPYSAGSSREFYMLGNEAARVSNRLIMSNRHYS